MTQLQNRFLAASILVLLAVIGVRAITVKNRSTNSGDKPATVSVVATYYPLYDFARNIGGDKVQVTTITPAGAEPHAYEPTPTQLVGALKSRLFIYNGGTLEPWVDNFLHDYKNITVRASDGIILFEGTTEATKKASEQITDPHFWLDPVLAERVVENIKDGLIKADPKDAAYFVDRADAYKAKLTNLAEDYRTELSICRTRTIITSHAAFSYLAKRYNLDVVSIAGLSPDEEPSTAKLAALTNLVKQKNTSYVFFESLVSPKLAQTLAAETGAKTLVLDPIEGMSNADQKQGKDYFSVQQQNLANLRTALACH